MARILFVSDLHTDVMKGNAATIEAFAELCQERQSEYDVLAIGGDLSPRIQEIERTLRLFSDIDVVKVFVAGNHDLWIPRRVYSKALYTQGRDAAETTSMRRFEELEGVCNDAGFHNLDYDMIVINDLGLVGTLGWYDYSFANPGMNIPIEAYEKKELCGTGIWNDGRYVHLGCSDIEFTRQLNKKLRKRIERVKELGAIRLAAFTHMVPFRELQRFPVENRSSFFDAYGGNYELGQILVDDHIEYSFSGHTHLNVTDTIRGVKCYQNPVGYLEQQEDPERFFRVIDLG
jgi:Icc-related predicted phosphoesterase